MPFLQVNVEQEIQKSKERTIRSLKKIWDESRAEYRFIGEMISFYVKRKKLHKRN